MEKSKKTTFKDLLKEADIHGAQLARKLKINKSTVSSWVCGKSAPRYERIPEIAEILNCTTDKVTECFIKNIR